MRITFQLRFHTQFGQSLWLSGNHEILGNGSIEEAVPLQYLNEELWQVTLVIPQNAVPDADIVYGYFLREADGGICCDWGKDRVINPASFSVPEVMVIDSWNSTGLVENAFYTEPFKEVLLKPDLAEVRLPSPTRITHVFKVKAPLLQKNQTLCLLGNVPALGGWNTARAILLNRFAGQDFLTAELDLSNATFPLAYKYCVYDTEKRSFLGYEAGPNRALNDSVSAKKLTIVNDGFARFQSTTWKGAGVAIPVFSLRSTQSFGVGEFADLKLLVDWCKRTGLKLIQILPVNDTTSSHTWLDSYPYAAISAFALHPLYLNLRQVAGGGHQALLESLETERKRLNALPAIDYEAVLRAKLAIIRQLFPLERDKTQKSRDYRRFLDANRDWLLPYAVFCYLRDKHRTPDFNQWPELRRYDPAELVTLTVEGSPAHDEITLTCFIQYHLHKQLQEATEYAHRNGVILKGDIAIGVARYGADVWQEPELYHLDMQAGAPPDAFGIKGQNWSFPTYNWPRMKEDGFAWWKRRFAQMGGYFDAFRVDHILGFFRIWSIPLEAVEGILGHFEPTIPVSAAEFGARGIAFDRNRLVQPFITDEVLSEVFGGLSAAVGADLQTILETVRSRCLEASQSGRFALKPEFATQRQVQTFIASQEDNTLNRVLRAGLYDLISNVILLEANRGNGINPDRSFHFRFGIESTSSFKYLDFETKSQLKELYIDYFFRRQEDFWRAEAMQKLPELKRATSMLVCGEDLGLVPACVPDVMKQLGLLGLEVQRMPKRMDQEFFRPSEAPYLSVVTPSTHDMSTIRGWWQEDRQVIQRFYNNELSQPGSAPESCEPWINQAIIQQHLASPAMWSIFQLQDLFGIDENLRRDNPEEERINVPANPKNYWRYRMHITLEQLLESDAFNHELNARIKETGR
ncbi:MAG TPA: 4-alpha-glucanotransferase [Candidatus Limnocylindrales bacterium]|jgi:4-alpha-glucanotransferase|nr:4-alpha-glucanotransferase [Candidatus Limnocylindrales bacterium]